jgi:hypothetical protein
MVLEAYERTVTYGREFADRLQLALIGHDPERFLPKLLEKLRKESAEPGQVRYDDPSEDDLKDTAGTTWKFKPTDPDVLRVLARMRQAAQSFTMDDVVVAGNGHDDGWQ